MTTDTTQPSAGADAAAFAGHTPGPAISRLAVPIRAGDWHDRPLKWTVTGLPEVQHFATKKDAISWARLRVKCATFNECFTRFMQKGGIYA